MQSNCTKNRFILLICSEIHPQTNYSQTRWQHKKNKKTWVIGQIYAYKLIFCTKSHSAHAWFPKLSFFWRSPNHTTFDLSIPNFGSFTGLFLAMMMSWSWRQMTPYWLSCRPRICGVRATTCALDPEASFLHSMPSRWQRMNLLKVTRLCYGILSI